MFIEIPANNQSLAQRKPVFGFGMNDADYMVQPTINNKRLICPYYKRWKGMIERCYDPKFHKKYPTYIGCSVHPEWVSFMAFRSWMVTQDWEGMELDKDTIKPSNKFYSPDNCCFISHALNALLTDHGAARGDWPQGVSWNKQRNKFMSYVNYNGKLGYLGLHITSESASNAYIKEKTKIILQAADEQTDPRIANGLRLHAELLNNS